MIFSNSKDCVLYLLSSYLQDRIRGIFNCNFLVYKTITNFNLYQSHDYQETLIKIVHLSSFTVSIETQTLAIIIPNIIKSIFYDLFVLC